MATDTYGEIGETGLSVSMGVIRDEPLRELTGREAYKRYDEMRRNSPVVAAMLAAIEQAIRTASWHFASDLGEDDPRLDLLNDSLAGMSHSWNDHLSEALTMLPFGYSLFEIVYQRVGGRVMWRKFAPRGQDTIDRWSFDDEGGLQGAYQRTASNYQGVLLPIEKCLLYRTRVERNNPEGRSLFRPAWIPYYYLKNIQQAEAIGIERDLAGLPVITIPLSKADDKTERNNAAKVVRNIRRDEQEGIVLVEGYSLQLLSTGGSRQFDTDKIIGRYEQRILMTALAQFLMLGQDYGAYSLSKDQTDFFNMATCHLADVVAEVMTKFAIPRLMRLNGLPADGLRYEHTPVGDTDLVALADFLQKTGALITWTADDETWLRGVAKLPERTPEEIQEERDRKAEDAIAIMQRTGGQMAQQQRQDDNNDAEDNEQMSAIPARTLGDLVRMLAQVDGVHD